MNRIAKYAASTFLGLSLVMSGALFAQDAQPAGDQKQQQTREMKQDKTGADNQMKQQQTREMKKDKTGADNQMKQQQTREMKKDQTGAANQKKQQQTREKKQDKTGADNQMKQQNRQSQGTGNSQGRSGNGNRGGGRR